MASPSPPPPSSAAAAAPRRLPPLCWTDDEAAAVAAAFRDKWLALGRGSLRAHDWQEVADAVAARCGTAKTPVQCRHKVEKLRKRYRNEKRRLVSSARPRPSSWALFSTFDAMESGGSAAAMSAVGRPVVTVARLPPPPSPSPSATPSISTSSDDGESEERSHLYANGYDARLVIPKLMQRSNLYDDVDTFRPKSAAGRHPIPSKKKRRLDEDADPMSEVVWAIQQLGERFMRVEQMKMEMAREVEKMRMETEMKRMKMMMETLLYPCHGIAGGKRQKKMPTPLH